MSDLEQGGSSAGQGKKENEAPTSSQTSSKTDDQKVKPAQKDHSSEEILENGPSAPSPDGAISNHSEVNISWPESGNEAQGDPHNETVPTVQEEKKQTDDAESESSAIG